MTQKSNTNVRVKPFLQAVGALEKEKLKLHGAIVAAVSECTPGWAGVVVNDVNVDQFGGAMTNLIFKVSKPEGENQDVLVRVYGEGTDSFFSRTEETHMFQMLSAKDIGVALLGEFENGRVEKLIYGTTLTSKDMRNPTMSAAIAQKMRQFHEIDIKIDRAPQHITEVHRLLEVARSKCVGPMFSGLCFDAFAKDVAEMESILSQVPSPLVLSHNDLQYGNIMSTDAGVVLIDFEYTSYNPRGYDLGNHFCEWAYDYHKTIQPHLGDFHKYPTLEQQRAFCRAYLGESASDAEIEQLRLEANTYSLASHLFWALWGFIQACQSEIDFDFLAYGQCRYDAFKSRVTLQQ